jgi:hypothetical protein
VTAAAACGRMVGIERRVSTAHLSIQMVNVRNHVDSQGCRMNSVKCEWFEAHIISMIRKSKRNQLTTHRSEIDERCFF